MEKRIVAIGGGELKSKETIKIDEYIVGLAKKRAGENRAVALFLGTASHDSMPYFNSFRKTYTSEFDIKAGVGLLAYGETDYENIKQKFLKADMVYVGGGDTKFMLDVWRKKGIDLLLCDAYERGVVISGLSAGAICWFGQMYTDYDILRGESADYKLMDGMGWLEGTMCPHYNLRSEFDGLTKDLGVCYAVENNAAIEFVDGKFSRAISAGGNAYLFKDGRKERL